jgi:hypothetical protein
VEDHTEPVFLKPTDSGTLPAENGGHVSPHKPSVWVEGSFSSAHVLPYDNMAKNM